MNEGDGYSLSLRGQTHRWCSNMMAEETYREDLSNSSPSNSCATKRWQSGGQEETNANSNTFGRTSYSFRSNLYALVYKAEYFYRVHFLLLYSIVWHVPDPRRIWVDKPHGWFLRLDKEKLFYHMTPLTLLLLSLYINAMRKKEMWLY